MIIIIILIIQILIIILIILILIRQVATLMVQCNGRRRVGHNDGMDLRRFGVNGHGK